jgi:hypothetical protein
VLQQLVLYAESAVWQGFQSNAILHHQTHKAQMAKLNIDFVLLDESVVMYGFRALMGGLQLEAFKKNPVMLFMHARAEEGYSKPLEEDVVLPIGKWYDIRVEGSQLLAKPEFDDNDEFALKIQSKVEGGFLNGASVWLEPFAVSEEPALMLQGQTGYTVTKAGILEASIVDIPNCRGALAIRNSAGKKLQLNAGHDADALDFLKTLLPNTNNSNMDKKKLAAKLGLDENVADEVLQTKLAAVMADAAKVPQLELSNTTLSAKVQELETERDTAKVEGLVDTAITANKLAAGDREKWIKLAKADFDTTKEMIDGMKAYVSLESKLSAEGLNEAQQAELDELLKLSGRDLYMKGKFEDLKKLSLPHYQAKYKEYFKVDAPV